MAPSTASACYGRLIPQTSDDEQVATALAALEAPDDSETAAVMRHRAVRTLRNAVLSEARFYRVVVESKLYSIDFGGVCNATIPTQTADAREPTATKLDEMRRRVPSLVESDYKVVRIQEWAKPRNGRTASARSRQQMMQQDRTGR